MNGLLQTGSGRQAPVPPEKRFLIGVLSHYLFPALVLAIVAMVALHVGLSSPLDHDENQFVAAGKLLANAEATPYRDYPYFQMPNQALVNAVIFLFTDHLLLGARLFSILCAIATIMIAYTVAKQALGREKKWLGIMLSLSVVVFLLCNPVFLYTSGKAWNHDSMVCMTMVSFWFACRAFTKRPATASVFGAAFFMGLAAGFRANAFPLIPLLWAVMAFCVKSASRREFFVTQIVFAAGLVSGLLPSLLFFIAGPARFAQHAFGYHLQIDPGYLQTIGRGMTASQIWRYLENAVTQHRFLPLVFLASASLLCLAFDSVRRRICPELLLAGLCALFLVLGYFGKNIIFFQYLYAPLPFMVLLPIYALKSMPTTWRSGIILIIVLSLTWPVQTWGRALIAHYDSYKICVWRPLAIHREAAVIAQKCGPGKILTLAPLYALEAGRSIYPALTTGPFAWRVGPYLPENRRRALGFVSSNELPALLKYEMPAAILTGLERNHESALEQYAVREDYRQTPVPAGVLWVRQDRLR